MYFENHHTKINRLYMENRTQRRINIVPRKKNSYNTCPIRIAKEWENVVFLIRLYYLRRECLTDMKISRSVTQT